MPGDRERTATVVRGFHPQTLADDVTVACFYVVAREGPFFCHGVLPNPPVLPRREQTSLTASWNDVFGACMHIVTDHQDHPYSSGPIPLFLRETDDRTAHCLRRRS